MVASFPGLQAKQRTHFCSACLHRCAFVSHAQWHLVCGCDMHVVATLELTYTVGALSVSYVLPLQDQARSSWCVHSVHIAHLLSITLPCITVLQPGEHGWNMVFFSSSSGCGPNAVKGVEAPPERGMLPTRCCCLDS